MAKEKSGTQEPQQLVSDLMKVLSIAKTSPEGKQLLEERHHVLLIIGDTSVSFFGEEPIIVDDEVNQLNPIDLQIQIDRNTWIDLVENRTTPTDAWFGKTLRIVDLGISKQSAAWFISLLRIYQGRYFWETLPSSLQPPTTDL